MEVQSHSLVLGILSILLLASCFASPAAAAAKSGKGQGHSHKWGNSTVASATARKGTQKLASSKVGGVGRALGAGATARGWSSHENSHGHHQVHYYQQHGNNNMDLYSLLAGLSFASLLGATIIYLARRNTSGRRRKRSLFAADVGDDEEDDGLFVPPTGVENWSWTGPLPSMEPIKLTF